jgi:outer membrane protein TolC
MRWSRSAAPTALAVLTLVSTFVGQTGQNRIYINGQPSFPNPLAPFTATGVPKPNFTNSARIDQVLKDGKLMLSMDDAIALALENNLDLAISRYNLSIADTDLLRTKSGAAYQGVNTGIVQNTPGGGAVVFSSASGGGAGGTSAAAGGAGAGTGGIVLSSSGAGPNVDSFDPVLTSTLSVEHATTPEDTPFATGLGGLTPLQQNTGTANFTYQQAFPAGLQYSIGFNNTRTTSNSLYNFLNPTLNSGMQLSIRQHLLQGFGVAPNRRFIRIAKNNREISDVAFRLQVITTVNQIENIYWNLVNAFEDVKAKQRTLDLNNRLLDDNRKQVQIGTLAPLEVVRAQSQVASSTQDLIVSQTNLQLQELYMKNAISRNLTDSQLMAAEVIPTDTMQVPASEPVAPIQDLIAEALSHRAELAEAHIDLTNRDITNKAAANALRPSLDLVANYGNNALGGQLPPMLQGLSGCVVGSISACLPEGLRTTSYGGIFSNLWTTYTPTYTVGFNVNIPLRNRGAQATQIRSQLEYRQAQMRLQQLENQIRIEVQNAQFGVQQNRARVEAAIKGQQLAKETLEDEQKKYALGASTTYNVLQTQQSLAAAESNLITAMAAYEQSRIEMDRATGLTLVNLGIELSEAETGNINHLPKVPNVVPSATVNATPASSPAKP